MNDQSMGLLGLGIDCWPSALAGGCGKHDAVAVVAADCASCEPPPGMGKKMDVMLGRPSASVGVDCDGLVDVRPLAAEDVVGAHRLNDVEGGGMATDGDVDGVGTPPADTKITDGGWFTLTVKLPEFPTCCEAAGPFGCSKKRGASAD